MEAYTKKWFEDNSLNNGEIKTGDRYLLDIYPVYENGRGKSPTNVEIWEVEKTDVKHYNKRRRMRFYFQAIRFVCYGKEFDYPTGCFRVMDVTKNINLNQNE
ncbi:MAG: hypothetical protein BWK75_01365 [Candidatus Altiarchaeales archaeon A3]|nr:MAG: hypothetical protein BWK75_01365 [Candidatus Altiarchaeales archaeon A3]